MNRIETFMSELADLMEKHRVEIDVNMSCSGYSGEEFDNIEFSSEPDWDNEDEPRYEEIEMGNNLTYKSIREELQERVKNNGHKN